MKTKKKDWREKAYQLAIFVCAKGHLSTTVKINTGTIPEIMPCLKDGCRLKSKKSMPKDRPVPPMIPYPLLEWRKEENNRTLLPWPLSTPESQWLLHE